MRKPDPLSIYERKILKSSPQELINLERTAQLYPVDKPVVVIASNVPFKGSWDSGRIL